MKYENIGDEPGIVSIVTLEVKFLQNSEFSTNNYVILDIYRYIRKHITYLSSSAVCYIQYLP